MVLTYHIRNLIIRVNLWLTGGLALFFASVALFSGRSGELGLMMIALAFVWIPPLLVWRICYWNAAYVFTSKQAAFVVKGKRVWSVASSGIQPEQLRLDREVFPKLIIVTPGHSHKSHRVYWIRPEKFLDYLERARAVRGIRRSDSP